MKGAKTMTMLAENITTDRVEVIRGRLVAYQKNGGSYKAVEKDTGISRTAISLLANHGVNMPGDKLTKIEQFLELNHPMVTQIRADDLFPEISGSLAAGIGEDQAPEKTVSAFVETGAPQARHKTDVGIYPTEDYRQTMGWCAYLFRHRKIGAMVGYPGSGKTTVLKAYCKANPAAHYIECWSSMRMGDLLDMIGEAAGVPLKGSAYRKQQQLIEALRDRTDFMILLDEAEYLKKWNVEKFETLRKLWDNTGTPVVFCGTPELVNVLTRGTGKDNCAQLYRRILRSKLLGIHEKEARAMLAEYNVDPDATGELVRIAMDHKHGGIGNMVEILQIALESAEGGQVDRQLVEDAKMYKLMY
jgi:DNA transposition AAA+ family ATPase